MKDKQRVASPPPGRWTRPDDYIEALVRKRSFRRAHRAKPRTEAERPRLMLSTVPFLALISVLAVLAAAIAVLAFPGTQPQFRTHQVPVKEKGWANPGWLQEAQKQMHH